MAAPQASLTACVSPVVGAALQRSRPVATGGTGVPYFAKKSFFERPLAAIALSQASLAPGSLAVYFSKQSLTRAVTSMGPTVGSLSRPYFAANSPEVRPLCSMAALQTELAL